MSEPERTSVRLKIDDAGKIPSMVEPYLKGSNPPDLVLLQLDSEKFHRRILDFPEDVRKYVMTHPRVKVEWGVGAKIVWDSNMRHEYINMTMVSVFYDANINPLRKTATKKAVECWMKQKSLPKEMMFIELGFNGKFTFSQEDFPPQIRYERINGDDSHKFIWQKENLWNIAGKKSKYDKLMFVDSDIAPLENVDWFKKVYDALDKCLFTQGTDVGVYLNQSNEPIITRQTFTYAYVHNKPVSCSKYLPGMAFCINKKTLEMIGWFNNIETGSSDVLFWSELTGDNLSSDNIMLTLYKRDNVKQIADYIMKSESKTLFENVQVKTCHFFHGGFANRSYQQRTFMWATQYPWKDRLIVYDDTGLEKWVDTSHYFYGVMTKFSTVNDNVNKAAGLFGDKQIYFNFIREFTSMNNSKDKKTKYFYSTKLREMNQAYLKFDGGYKIDYLVTFLDPTDPYWLKQFAPYAKEEFKIQKPRYDEDGIRHLKYHFRGIAKYMPWVNNVFLVVFSESQVPKWINRDTVKVITDDMYIPEKFRPTFNTSTKQMHFQFIPGLEEHFIWADDDQFTINPVYARTYFDENGNPYSEWTKSIKMSKPKNGNDIWENIVWNSTQFAYIATDTPHDDQFLFGTPAFHTPHASIKSDMVKYYNENYDMIEKSITPCRASSNIIGYAWCMVNGLKYTSKTHIKSFQIFEHNMHDNHNLKQYQKQGIQIFNINNNDRGDYYKDQLESIFPEKCKYEV